jgi:predicted MFS family arabinose efflux permease
MLAFTAVMAFSTVPTPLYSIYQAHDGFSTFMITVIFAAYAVGVILALFFAGHLSDSLGRRRMLVPAVLLSAASAIVFLLWHGLPGLLLGRVASGLSVGIVTATATAYIAELHLGEHPGASPSRAQVLAMTANLGGVGLGALIAGLLAQYVAAPLTVPFLLFIAVLGVSAVAAALAPETVTARSPRPTYHPQRVAVPRHARAQFYGAAAGGFASLAALGLFTSLGPTFLAGTLHHTSHALAGVPPFTAFVAAVVAQIAAGSWEVRRLLATGMAALAAGVTLVVLATWLPSLAVFLVGGAAAGVGGGLLFKGGIVTVTLVADPERRAEALAGFFLAAYVGISVPVLGLGLLGQFVEPRVGLLAFAGLLLSGLAAAGRPLLGAPGGSVRVRRPRIPRPAAR